MSNILVTGGAGYFESHACKTLKAAGFTPITYDNFSSGWRDAARFGPIEEGDLLDPTRLNAVFEMYRPVGGDAFRRLGRAGSGDRRCLALAQRRRI